MYRTRFAFLFMLTIVGLAAVAPSSGWAQGNALFLVPERLTFIGAYDFWWSPDGTKIVFESRYNTTPALYDIYVMNANGDNLVQLTRNMGGRSSGNPRWSPDGTKIAFVSRYDTGLDSYEIYVMDANGDNLVQLTRNNFYEEHPKWSPDGTKIVFATRNYRNYGIYVMDANGDNLVQLMQNSGGLRYPEWSPDGTKIAFQAITDEGLYGIYVMDANGDNLVQLTRNMAYGFSVKPRWSPDGTKIAFQATPPEGGGSEIYVLPYGAAAPTPTEHGDTRERATAVGPDSTTPSALERAGDVDYFRVDVPRAGRLTVETAGWTNTAGVLQSAQGRSIAEDDYAGTGYNFRIAREVASGTYYVAVRGASRSETGAYTLRLAFTPAEDQGNTERGDRRATLLNLSPWQAWVHLYCLKDQGTDVDPPAACAVTFECNGQSGEPVAWPVEVAPKTIFSY